MKTIKHRDLTLIDINDKQTLVISCDSSGGIGEKKDDIIKTTPEVVGYFGAQVSMMEILSFGARPISVIDTLSVEMESTGRRIIKGIKEALEPLEFDIENILTGSSEENFPVSVTGVGITVIGIINKEDFIFPKTKSGLIAALVGVPKVGDEILKNRTDIINIEKLLKLKEKDYIKEILPVGSKGILHEFEEMAKTNNLEAILEKHINKDIYKSAGPSTCVIVSLEKEKFENLKLETPLPVEKIGEFI
ncbi:MAG: AIR synthase related protein [Tissierella sp.]|uniref:AIR synthase related protein n=1 Tax=Tissierella sp. TaxID=41274 RepID=UPI003F975DDF